MLCYTAAGQCLNDGRITAKASTKAITTLFAPQRGWYDAQLLSIFGTRASHRPQATYLRAIIYQLIHIKVSIVKPSRHRPEVASWPWSCYTRCRWGFVPSISDGRCPASQRTPRWRARLDTGTHTV